MWTLAPKGLLLTSGKKTESRLRAIDSYHREGFMIVQVFDESEVRQLETFATEWLLDLLKEWAGGLDVPPDLGSYHAWSKSLGVDHRNTFRAKNRHTIPDAEIAEIVTNSKIRDVLTGIGLGEYTLWDEGLGWLAFRFVRPGAEDGYPMTCKFWGPAKRVVSCWVPIIGYEPAQTLTLVPGSHLNEYEKILPNDAKFRSDEYRLIDQPKETFSPRLNRGEVILYHPRVLHSENVVEGGVTRLSLEYRFSPVDHSASHS